MRVYLAACLGIIAYTVLPSQSAGASTDSLIYGADGSNPIAVGTSPTFLEPNCTQYRYRTYLGELGYSYQTQNSTGSNPEIYSPSSTLNSTAVGQAHTSYSNGYGYGAGGYYFLTGLAETGLSLTAANATNWGAIQAQRAVNYLKTAQTESGNQFTMGFIFADVETYSATGAPNNGWVNSTESSNYVALNQDEVLGFINYLQQPSVAQNVGVYSGPSIWSSFLGNLSISQAEWTNNYADGSFVSCPTSQFVNGTHSGNFFGGQTGSSSTALLWQFVSSLGGDYDQADFTHYNTMFGG